MARVLPLQLRTHQPPYNTAAYRMRITGKARRDDQNIPCCETRSQPLSIPRPACEAECSAVCRPAEGSGRVDDEGSPSTRLSRLHSSSHRQASGRLLSALWRASVAVTRPAHTCPGLPRLRQKARVTPNPTLPPLQSDKSPSFAAACAPARVVLPRRASGNVPGHGFRTEQPDRKKTSRR